MAAPVLKASRLAVAVSLLLLTCQAYAAALQAPGDRGLRHDLLFLNDHGVVNLPLSTWPVPVADIRSALESVRAELLDKAERAAFDRLQSRFPAAGSGWTSPLLFEAAAATEPEFIRTFENTPRDEGQVRLRAEWRHGRLSAAVSVGFVANPLDGDELAPDGTYVAFDAGNWILAAGWIERWYGSGHDGSLVLGTNARPTPGISLQRGRSRPFAAKWLSWIGPWSLTTFMTLLDDERAIDDAWLFGVRGSARPMRGLEIGVSRTAQWCGDARPCNAATFADLLVGNDNRGVNVPVDDEPGNQLGGFDIRWSLPRQIPVALYMQWIGEDGRGGGGAIGSWLRQAGVEWWGAVGAASHRTHIEVSDTTCQEGGFGFSGSKPDCAYEHGVYQTGYRYQGRSLAHGSDGDSLSYSIGSTLVQSAGHTWNATLRYMEINREGLSAPGHTLSSLPQERFDLRLTHQRRMAFGQVYLGIGYQRVDSPGAAVTTGNLTGFIQWSSR